MSNEPSIRDDPAAASESSDDQGDALPSTKSPDVQKSQPDNQSALSRTQSPSPRDLPQDLPQGTTVRQETAPPLPLENPPPTDDDGWDPVWDPTAQAFYFYNRFTNATQWDNPRVPSAAVAPGLGTYDRIPSSTVLKDSAAAQQKAPPPRPYGGYDPAIHGDYDPTAPYAQEAATQAGDDESLATAAGLGGSSAVVAGGEDPGTIYTATGAFNRFTGKWQASTIVPENHNDENKSKRQMSAFFDVDAAANSHNGKSLKAERSGKKLTKQELKAFKEKRKEKKEERRRAWLRD